MGLLGLTVLRIGSAIQLDAELMSRVAAEQKKDEPVQRLGQGKVVGIRSVGTTTVAAELIGWTILDEQGPNPKLTRELMSKPLAEISAEGMPGSPRVVEVVEVGTENHEDAD